MGRGRGVAVGKHLPEPAVGHGLRFGCGGRVERDFARVHRLLKRGDANRLAGGRTDEQRQRVVGEVRVGREVERRAPLVGRQRGNDGSTARRVGLRGLRRGADQRNYFIQRQPAVRQEANQQRAVALRLGGEEDIAFRAGGRGEHGQNLGYLARNPVDLVAQRVVKHGIAAGLHQHFARHGGVGVADAHIGVALKLLRIQFHGARRAGDCRAREGDAEHPRPGAAHAQNARLAGIDRGVDVKRAGRVHRRRGQRQARAARAGHERGHAGERVIRVGIRAARGAGHIDGKGMRLGKRLDHVDRLQVGERFGVGGDRRRAERVEGFLRDAHIGELPVAGLRRLAQRQRRRQAQRKQQPEGNKSLHRGKVAPFTTRHAARFNPICMRPDLE